MDIAVLLSKIKTIDGYVNVTNDIISKDLEAQLNIGTLLELKKIKNYEIQYFQLKNSPGAASIILSRLLKLPPNTRNWRVIGKEIVDLLHYWLSTAKDYKFKNNSQRWTFLQVILRHLNEVGGKHNYMANTLVKETTESLLALATKHGTPPHQTHEILHCLNKFCANSNKDLRMSIQRNFQRYFIKLGAMISRADYLPAQQAALETLFRWMTERHLESIRAAAADLWLPKGVCPEPARRLFVHSKWKGFYIDARVFLNTVNEDVGLITSVKCKKLTIGEVVVITGNSLHGLWVDINGSHSLSLMVHPALLKREAVTSFDPEAIAIQGTGAEWVTLTSVSGVTRLVLRTLSPLRLTPSGYQLADSCDVTALLAHTVPLAKLDEALRKVFADKYQSQIDLHDDAPPSPQWSEDISVRAMYNSGEETRFSIPSKLSCGDAVSGVNRNGLASSSNESNSPLQLHEKLETIPKCQLNRERVKISTQPQLSSVTERTEEDRNYASLSKFKFRRAGVCVRPKHLRKTAVSDDETQKRTYQQPSPIVSNNNTTSCLLVATIGSADDSVINDTRERLSRNYNYKDEEIIDLLMQQALAASNTNTDHNKQIQCTESHNEVIENTPTQVPVVNPVNKNDNNKSKHCTVVSATDEESNTEAICNTPVYSTLRNDQKVRKILKVKIDRLNLVEKDINTRGYIETTKEMNEIPNNADKKSNQTSNVIPDIAQKESNVAPNVISDNAHNNSKQTMLTSNKQQIIDNPGVTACLKDILDTNNANDAVVNKDDKVPNKENSPNVKAKKTKGVNKPKQTSSRKRVKREKTKNEAKKRLDVSADQINKETNEKESNFKNACDEASVTKKSSEKVILNMKLATDKPSNASKTIGKKNIKITKERKNQTQTKISHDQEITTNLRNKKNVAVEDSNITIEDNFITKRKRKLYSPEDHELRERKIMRRSQSEEDDVPLSKYNTKNNKSIDSMYSDWKREKLNNSKSQKIKKTNNDKDPPTPKVLSPSTLKWNDAFEKVKNMADNEVTLVEKKVGDTNIYNFTSESDDDDFEKKKNIKKSMTTISRTTRTPRYGKRKKLNYSELSSNDENNKEKQKSKQKKVTKKVNKNKTVLQAALDTDMIDERMRESTKEILNTSIIIAKGEKENASPNDKPNLRVTPQMEIIVNEPRKTRKKPLITNKLSIIKDGYKIDSESNGTTSPLPGLVIETVPDNQPDKDSMSDSKLKGLLKALSENPEAINNTYDDTHLILDEASVNNYEIVSVPYNKENGAKEKFQNRRLQKDRANVAEDNKKNKSAYKSSNKHTTISSKHTDVITISNLSIGSDDINAHGDMEEMPPNPEMIRKSMYPREIEDMDNSMKDYYVALNQVISRSPEPANIAAMTKLSENGSSPNPVVSIERLSVNDYLRYLPSRRSSDSEPSSVMDVITTAEIHCEPSKHNWSKHVKTPKDTIPKSSDSKSPVQKTQSSPSIPKVFEDFDKIIAMPGSPKSNKSRMDSQNSRHGYNTRNKGKVFQVSPDIRASKRATRQPKKAELEMSLINSKITIKNTSTITNKTDTLEKTKLDQGKRYDKTTKNSDKTEVKVIERTISTNDSEEIPKKIIISPVRSFGHVATDENDSEGDEYVQKYRTLFSKPSPKTVEVANKFSSSGSQKREIEIFGDKYATVGDIDDVSESERFSSEVKRKRIEERDLVDTESGRSIASVKEWFKRMDVPSSEEIDPYKDVLDGLMEKVDTVLQEMNHNTSKKLINLYLGVQMRLNANSEVRERLCAELAGYIEELKIRWQKLDEQLSDDLKQKSAQVVKEDADQKRALVVLLKEDIQAVAQHLERIKKKQKK